MVGLSAAEGGARLLSFAFYLLAARVLVQTDFGIVRYTITLSLVAFAGLQVLVKALMRELGGARDNVELVREILGTGVMVSVVIFVLSGVLILLASRLGLTGSAEPVGMVGVLAGTACFQLYYAMGRGIGLVARPAVTYVGASACQLAIFGLFALLVHPSVAGTLWIYGATGAIPLVICEVFKPILRRNHLRVTAKAARILWKVSAPLVLGQVAYIVWNSADQIWVESALGTTQIALYGAAKNVSQIFIVLPAGANGALLPRMAELRAAKRVPSALTLLYRTTFVLMAASTVIALVVIVFRVDFMRILYGAAYTPAAAQLAVLAVAMTIYAGHFTLTGSAIGLGRPGISTSTICVAAVVEVLVLVFGHGSSATFAAWAYAGSIGAGFAIAIILMAFQGRRLRKSHRDETSS